MTDYTGMKISALPSTKLDFTVIKLTVVQRILQI